MAQKLELGMISSTWVGTHVDYLEGIKKAKEIGFDTYDIFDDPLDIDDAHRKSIKDACEAAGLPIRSCVCVAFGIVDFNPSVERFTLSRVKAYIDQAAYFGARNVLLVIGEYYWDGEVFPRAAIWDMVKGRSQQLADYAAEKGVEIVLELEPFSEALVNNTDNLVRFVKDVDRPNFRANADISHLHLSDASMEDVAKMTGLIGHIHLSDCNGDTHGDLPAGLGVTPIKEYLQAIIATGYEGTVSIELEYSPDPAKIVEWATTAYTNTAAIMRELGVRA